MVIASKKDTLIDLSMDFLIYSNLGEKRAQLIGDIVLANLVNLE